MKLLKLNNSSSDSIDRYLNFLWEKWIIQSEKEKSRAKNKNYDYRWDIKKAVNELIRVTKKNGHIFVLVPNTLFPLEIHSKTLFGNYFPKFIHKKLWDNMALSFTKDELVKYFEGVKILKVGSWTRHAKVNPLKFDLTIPLPEFGLYLLGERI